MRLCVETNKISSEKKIMRSRSIAKKKKKRKMNEISINNSAIHHHSQRKKFINQE